MNWFKKSLSKIKHAYALYYFILVLIIFLPTAITMPSLSFRSAIITAIGVDKQEDEIAVSVLALSEISKSEMRENTKLLEGTGPTLANAISNIESAVGRHVRMGHVGYIVISQDFADENIAEVLNTLIVAGKVSNTVPLLMCNGKASDLLDKALNMEQSSSYKMREMINNEFNETFTKDISIDAFLKGYYSDIHISTLGYVTLESESVNGIDSSSGQSGEQSAQPGTSSGGQASQEEQKNTISYKTEHAVFNKGKFQYLLSEDEMSGVNWIVEGELQKMITITGINEQNMQDASITFAIDSHAISPDVSFIAGRPYVTFEVSLTLAPVEIIQTADDDQKSLKTITLSDEMQEKINDVVKREVAVALTKLRQEKTDVIGVYKLLYNHYRPFMDFLDTLPDKTDFLKYVNIGVDVKSFITSN